MGVNNIKGKQVLRIGCFSFFKSTTMSNEAFDFDNEPIDRYLDGQMEEGERVTFEQQMAQNARLAHEVELLQDIRNGIDLYGLKYLKERLKASDHNPVGLQDAQKAQNRYRLYVWAPVAASLAAILLVGYIFFHNQADYRALVAARYQTYPNIISPVDRSSADTGDELKEALYAYEHGQYQRAATLFERNADQLDEGYRFYQALSYFEIDQTDKAIDLLSRVKEKENSLFYFPSLWYQALAYLKTDRMMQARDNLELLSEVENSYQQEASNLLEEIN